MEMWGAGGEGRRGSAETHRAAQSFKQSKRSESHNQSKRDLSEANDKKQKKRTRASCAGRPLAECAQCDTFQDDKASLRSVVWRRC